MRKIKWSQGRESSYNTKDDGIWEASQEGALEQRPPLDSGRTLVWGFSKRSPCVHKFIINFSDKKI